MNIIKEKGVDQRFVKSADYFKGQRSDLFSLIPKECKKLLDVGCGAGEYWKGFSGEVTGIELNKEAAERAKANMKEVFSCDIELAEIPVQKGSFDCIIFADVLEHLYDPWGTLLKYRQYLSKNGYLLVSVPNIQNYRVLRALFKGEFGYEESGILDIDHIRFFTRKELVTLLSSTGFEIVTLRRNFIASTKYVWINKMFGGLLNDFLTGQYYILARLTGSG
jgi:2-polyprenyl-3-methyl-5-hydroxy-6-metoxy-1,4-benzoquinol methylase